MRALAAFPLSIRVYSAHQRLFDAFFPRFSPPCSSRSRLLVLGPGSDTAAVRLYAAALDGASPPADSADEARLRRALDALAEVLDAKRDEADAFAEAAEKRKQPAAPEAELTEAEKIALGR